MKKVYIHIGSPKTGTTTIQGYLSQNYHEFLGKHRIFYPTSGRNFISHHPLAADIRTKYMGAKIPDHCYGSVQRGNCWETLREELLANKESYDIAIVSSEDFFVFAKREMIEEIKEHLSGFDVKIVVYLRRQDKLINSLYNQAVKATLQSEVTVNKIINNHNVTRMDYLAKMKLWSSVFLKENMIIRSFERKKLKDKDILSDFLSLINIPYQVNKESNQNFGLSHQEVIFKKKLNGKFDDNIACISCFEKLRQNERTQGSLFSKEEYESIVNKNVEVNAEMIKEFNLDNDFFDDFPDSSDIHYSEVTSELMKAYLISLINIVKATKLTKIEKEKVDSVINEIKNDYKIILFPSKSKLTSLLKSVFKARV